MTREEIIQMTQKLLRDPTAEDLMRFAVLVAAAEREACAKVCDAEASIEGIAQRCADAIRARGGE